MLRGARFLFSREHIVKTPSTLLDRGAKCAFLFFAFCGDGDVTAQLLLGYVVYGNRVWVCARFPRGFARQSSGVFGGIRCVSSRSTPVRRKRFIFFFFSPFFFCVFFLSLPIISMSLSPMLFKSVLVVTVVFSI